MRILELLRNNADNAKELCELVDAFEEMSKIAINGVDEDDDMLLFEIGTFGCIDKKMFQLALVRQWPNEDEEYCQLHLNILYQPNKKNATFSNSVWDEDIDTDFFTYIRQSAAYLALMQEKIIKIDIYQDAT